MTVRQSSTDVAARSSPKTADPGVVHEDVQTAEALHGPVDHALRLPSIADVGLDRLETARACRRRPPAGLSQRRGGAAADDDIAPQREQRRCHRRADAARAAGNDRHPPGQL